MAANQLIAELEELGVPHDRHRRRVLRRGSTVARPIRARRGRSLAADAEASSASIAVKEHSRMLAWAVITSLGIRGWTNTCLPPIGQRIWKPRLAVQTSVDRSLVR